MIKYILLIILLLLIIAICRKSPKRYRYKGEGKLYETIKKDYRDAIYQYRCKWLGRQTYDIYLPSKKIAIEYQGEQHFGPISHFGGYNGYKKQKRLDKLKKEKSRNNGVVLLYFTYNKKMPSRLLGKKVYKTYKDLRWRIRLNWLYRIIGI